MCLCVCVRACVRACMRACVAKPVAVELRCHATALIQFSMKKKNISGGYLLENCVISTHIY